MRQRQSPEDAPRESHFVPALQFMFPNPQHAPAEGAERAGDEAVAGAVGSEFFPPEGGVGFGLRGVERAGSRAVALAKVGRAKKQPSTKTERRCALKTKSGFTRKGFNFSPSTFHWSEAPRPQAVMPRARKSAMRRCLVAAFCLWEDFGRNG